jgi:hypothetical protein
MLLLCVNHAMSRFAANAYDSPQLLPLVDAIPPIIGPTLRRALQARGITPRIARRGIDSSERPAATARVVERTLAWLLGFRRLGVRYERRADLLQGLLHLACALTCVRFLGPSPA